MRCSSVGHEIWALAIFSAVSLYLFTFRVRSFQRWLRLRTLRHPGLRMVPALFLNESSLWSMRVLAVLPAIMFLVAILGVFCSFHGPG